MFGLKKLLRYISRETYAIIDKRSSTWTPKIGKLRKSCYKSVEDRQKVYDDEECKIYSDDFCEKHREKCLQNFDLNMLFFAKLKQEKFESCIEKLLSSNKKISKVDNLDEWDQICGIYILVLDKYKQVYICQSTNIKQRILCHWRKKKQFDRLIFGTSENSVLSIDSFGALDTTRIFVLKTQFLDEDEKKILKKIPNIYKLNRIGGGKFNNVFDKYDALANTNHRKLQ